MRKIEIEMQKKIMVELLEYFDLKCRENNILYSLIGGSLIGAVRHKGIIPWDDDIDVILTIDNYYKIIDVLKNDNNSKFKLLTSENCEDYYFPFPKLVDTTTYLIEPMSIKKIKEYGIYIDIFCYLNVSNHEEERRKTIKKMKLLNKIISRRKVSFKKMSIEKVFIGIIRNSVSMIIGQKRLLKKVNKILDNNKDLKSDYSISNWPIYDDDKEIQLSKNLNDYIEVPFENIHAMIFKNYDEILKTTFGDYMKLPPENKRISHGLIAYRREDNEQIKK